MKLVPDFPIQIAGTRKSPDSTKFQNRIERSEVVQFHGDASRGPTERGCQFNNDHLPGVELPESKLVIKIENDQKFVTSPAHTLTLDQSMHHLNHCSENWVNRLLLFDSKRLVNRVV